MLSRTFFVFITLFLTVKIHSAEEIKLTNGEWPPFLSQNLEHHGVGSRIVSEAFAEAGYKATYGFFPWDKALELARAGVWNGSIAWTYNDDRAKFFYYSEPIFDADEVFFYLKSKKIDWEKWEDLKPYKIGATGGYYYGEAFKQAEENNTINVIRADSDVRNFKKLLEGQIDLTINNEYVGWFLLQSEFDAGVASKITYHPITIRSGSWHLLMSKANPRNDKIIKDFNKGLNALKEKHKIKEWLDEAKGFTTKEVQKPAE